MFWHPSFRTMGFTAAMVIYLAGNGFSGYWHFDN
jgi:hypothetical protein